jgi:RNA polymerase sigma-70 factor, ECF subfamily
MTLDHETISDLFRQLAPALFRRCRRLLGNDEEARDATQDAFVRLIQRGEDLDDPAHRVAWLYRVSTNVCLDRLRRRWRSLPLPPEALPEIPDERPRFDDVLASREQLSRILEAATESERQVLVYWIFDGMTQTEIARLMNTSRRTIGERIRRLRARASAITEEEAGDEPAT